MSALFTPRSNALFRLVLVLLVAGATGGVSAGMIYGRTPYGTGQQQPVAQPIQFDHRHHVRDDQIDCRYCHTTVDSAPSAGIPPTELCLNCHSQVWNKSPLLDRVRASWFARQPVPWVRVHKLPDFVYFNHSIHVNKGVGCVECHGRVDEMAAIEQEQPLTMGWCLECHRDPYPRLRPPSEVTNMTWKPDGDPRSVGEAVAKQYDVHPRTDCITCHR